MSLKLEGWGWGGRSEGLGDAVGVRWVPRGGQTLLACSGCDDKSRGQQGVRDKTTVPSTHSVSLSKSLKDWEVPPLGIIQ